MADPAEDRDPLLVVLGRIATALETIAERDVKPAKSRARPKPARRLSDDGAWQKAAAKLHRRGAVPRER